MKRAKRIPSNARRKSRWLARMRRRAVVQNRGKLFRNLRRIVALINGERGDVDKQRTGAMP